MPQRCDGRIGTELRFQDDLRLRYPRCIQPVINEVGFELPLHLRLCQHVSFVNSFYPHSHDCSLYLSVYAYNTVSLKIKMKSWKMMSNPLDSQATYPMCNGL